jgi:transcriptional/translational regulatory protein YebC/TACO1
MFTDRGLISLSEEEVDDLEGLMDLALEHGAIEFEDEDGVVTLMTEPTDFMELRGALEQEGYDEFMTDEITKLADSTVAPDVGVTRRNLHLIEQLEDHDDVENVYHNLELSDEAAEALS